MSRIKRREFLAGVGAAATLALAGCKDDEPKDQAPPGPKGTEAIEHIIFVMMENRSFDHYLGGLNEDGRDDINGIKNAAANFGYDGVGHLPTRTRRSDLCPGDPPHGWTSSRAQFAEGANSGFVKAYVDRHGNGSAHIPMGYFDRSGVPITWALADSFSICDQWFCSLMSSTWPNRVYAHCAQNEGQFGNDMPPGQTFYECRSVWDSLDDADVDWGYYYSDVPFTVLLGVKRDEVQPLENFFAACRTGTLPTVSQIEPSFLFNSDHPPQHPMLGQVFLASIYEALAQSELWGKCLLVITYDEHGGFYDHVPPGTTDDEHASAGFEQLGFRVPARVVGPWVKQGAHDTVLSHASPLKYVCERFGIEPWTARIGAANSLSELLDAERMAANDPLPAVVLPAFEVPEEEVGPDCNYDIAVLSGQTELVDWLQKHAPAQVKQYGRDDLLEQARRLELIR
jgi:phospholipase C